MVDHGDKGVQVQYGMGVQRIYGLTGFAFCRSERHSDSALFLPFLRNGLVLNTSKSSFALSLV